MCQVNIAYRVIVPFFWRKVKQIIEVETEIDSGIVTSYGSRPR